MSDEDERPVLSAQDVWKLFRMGDDIVNAVCEVNLAVHRGEFVCLMGPSGSGKSTLLHLLGGLDRPTRGTIYVGDQDTTGLSEGQFSALRHSRLGFIFQSFNLIPFLSAVENIELPLIFEPIDRAALRTRALELMEVVGISHRRDYPPSRLSGGEQQRVAVARALIASPAVVLADEPTANLDRASGADVVALLKDLCRRMDVAVVASTHDPSVADQASRVLTMSDGRLTAGPPAHT